MNNSPNHPDMASELFTMPEQSSEYLIPPKTKNEYIIELNNQ